MTLRLALGDERTVRLRRRDSGLAFRTSLRSRSLGVRDQARVPNNSEGVVTYVETDEDGPIAASRNCGPPAHGWG